MFSEAPPEQGTENQFTPAIDPTRSLPCATSRRATLLQPGGGSTQSARRASYAWFRRRYAAARKRWHQLVRPSPRQRAQRHPPNVHRAPPPDVGIAQCNDVGRNRHSLRASRWQCIQDLPHAQKVRFDFRNYDFAQEENEAVLEGQLENAFRIGRKLFVDAAADHGRIDVDTQRLRSHRFPRSACSRSMLTKSALKFPRPKPRLPWRSMTSKKSVGRS